ncbi:hypothetical protein M408DRAFT_255003 [Serendipita vermifera MAFF 305830]|uniref:Uncharacterized protein n=1 Tax=Serendipita vermifera MAFF 305830 TaxID=933852 RepID=A0A0C3BGB1_SERVB|nr:hypothetical protein M408DRAFT_255003 [Serendipita vermifera MAFF 305830]
MSSMMMMRKRKGRESDSPRRPNAIKVSVPVSETFLIVPTHPHHSRKVGRTSLMSWLEAAPRPRPKRVSRRTFVFPLLKPVHQGHIDKAIDFYQEHVLHAGDQKHESALEQAKDARIASAIRHTVGLKKDEDKEHHH